MSVNRTGACCWFAMARPTGTAEGRIQGHGDVPLNALGPLAQARVVRRRAGAHDRVISVICSDLVRTRETAEAHDRATGFDVASMPASASGTLAYCGVVPMLSGVLLTPKVWPLSRR